uniref:CCHC-type domain-containing protein n=1 Tax=Tanacetum cinerariifolium TaxID=118510 RepID=A0A6L2NKR8_TANCI|nr:hypothetical protein [Tanacetum cinerariifolium]
MGKRVGRGGRDRGPKGGNDECVNELNGQRNDQGLGANWGVKGVNGNVEGVNGGVGEARDFLTIIAQQLQNLLPVMLAQVGNQENVGNQNGNVVNENVQENVENVIVNGNRNHAMVWASHAAYTDRFYELSRLVPHLVTPKSRKIKSALTDEVVKNGSIKKVEKRGNVGKPSKDKNDRDDNKRNRTENAFASTTNPVGRENMGAWPKCTTCNSYHAPEGPCRTCFNCNRLGHLAKYCKGVPRNVNPINARNPTVRACYECGSTDHVRSACLRLNRAQGLGRNHPNQVAANNGCQGRRNQARGRAFMLGAEEARHDPNIMTCIELNELGFRYKIEIASGQLVEIDKGYAYPSICMIVWIGWVRIPNICLVIGEDRYAYPDEAASEAMFFEAEEEDLTIEQALN